MPQLDQTEVEDRADMADAESASVVVSEKFPFGRPGAPIPDRAESSVQELHSLWAPFQSRLDWDVARWAKLSGQTSTAMSELLAIPGVSVPDFLYCASNLMVIGRRCTRTIILHSQ